MLPPVQANWALRVPLVTLPVFGLHPERRGPATSLQAFMGQAAHRLVAGLLAPLRLGIAKKGLGSTRAGSCINPI